MAALASLGALALLLLSGLSCCSAEACVEPQITPSYYTTSDAVISTETVFIVEISLTCKNRVQSMALYADVSGKQFPVTRGQDVGRYQVSWSLDHKSAHAGTYEVRFFDEESYSLLRKAQRNNEDISVIPPLFTVSVDHRVSGLKRLTPARESTDHPAHLAFSGSWGLGHRWAPGTGPGSPLRYWLPPSAL
ncbi:translocon-associated protein subunit delta isoform X1 [Camelus ferus]|uniref:Translocon-associated protein subunit delta n=2 Tax=Camelus TaxID=9836 RepID=A0A8B8SQR3_CAMFR|nr:translocon-associated protein subunit delta isoform X1 [Camelus dromedarius]XP_032331782.1 translocon-associated protein subunit delta isoform X1 [Camelus ferus]XP_045379386.1 translocon-associated protein subunit delta isoform X1 [Camelus bactrianus]